MLINSRILELVNSHFVLTETSTTKIYPLSLHDALPISVGPDPLVRRQRLGQKLPHDRDQDRDRDRKSTRLNSSHVAISYAVFCLKKKKKTKQTIKECIKINQINNDRHQG